MFLSVLQITEPTAVDWYNFIRDIHMYVCAEYFQRHQVMIGGVGVEVKIDELKFGRRKYIIEAGGKRDTGFLEGYNGSQERPSW